MDCFDILFRRKITPNFIGECIQEPLYVPACYLYFSWSLYTVRNPLNDSFDSGVRLQHIL